MSLHYVSCALVLASCAAPVSAVMPPTLPPTSVTTVLVPDERYSPLAVSEMGREAAKILKRSGLAFHWRVSPADEVYAGLLIVVRLRGRCDMDSQPAEMRTGALGWSHEVNGKILPFSDLACDRIRGVIQPAMPENRVQENLLLGRAMGRVLAHELYHVLANTDGHRAGGVTQPGLSARELTSGHMDLRLSDIEAIQNGLRKRVSGRASAALAGLGDPSQ